MSYHDWPDYVSVAERRRRAEKDLAKLRKKGRVLAPVIIAGRKIAGSFWGKSWCDNLERYSDYASRLPRGRSYLGNGLVIDLQITRGKISAVVSGSELYDVTVTIAPVAAKRWRAVCVDCSGAIDSLVELLQGRLAKSVMDRVCREGDGLFPAPKEIKLSCSCPDSAKMCKHVAATLYGVGARLDEAPQLLFTLRGVDESELLAGAGRDLAISKPLPAGSKVLGDDDVAALFGLDMAEADNSGVPDPIASKLPRRTKTMKDKTSRPPDTLTTNGNRQSRARSEIKSKQNAKRAMTKSRVR
jgi:uncharacterized Zn finger protein